MKRTTYLLILILMLLPGLLLPAYAQGELGYAVRVTPESCVRGETVEVLISLDNYTADVPAILDIQVDLGGIDETVLEVVSCSSMLQDPGSATVTVKYSETNKRVRLICMNLQNEPLSLENQDLLKVVLKVKEDVTADGSVNLPLSVKLTNVDRENITLTGQVPVQYTLRPVYDVDIAWGDLSYTYTDGTWNPETYRYEGAGWSADGENGGEIRLTNNGAPVTAVLTYTTDRTDIRGSFDKQQLVLGREESGSAVLLLEGQPREDLNHTVIGKVTITLE